MDLGEMGLWFSSLNIIESWCWTVESVSFIMCGESRGIPISTLPVNLMIQYKYFSKNTLFSFLQLRCFFLPYSSRYIDKRKKNFSIHLDLSLGKENLNEITYQNLNWVCSILWQMTLPSRNEKQLMLSFSGKDGMSWAEADFELWKSFHFASLPLRNVASFPGVTAKRISVQFSPSVIAQLFASPWTAARKLPWPPRDGQNKHACSCVQWLASCRSWPQQL